MLAWGLTFLAPRLLRSPIAFVGYWITCFGLTSIAFSIAIYDMRVMRRRLRDEEKSAFHNAFRDITEEKKN